MGGEGFSWWAEISRKNNRLLLKGKHVATYKNFDKSYITDYIISRKPLILKEASPEYLEELRRKLAYRRKKEVRRKLKAAALTLIIILAVAGILFWS